MTGRAVTILMVDDDKIDAMAVKRSFRHLKIANPLIMARDGIDALDQLRGLNGYEKVAPPYLILLDLNMPRMGGIAFLGELRSDPLLQHALVFVMTTSAAPEDRRLAYERNVAGYLLKHRTGDGFLESMSMLKSYWRSIEFPTDPAPADSERTSV